MNIESINDKYIIERVYFKTQTLGSWYDPEHRLMVKTLELPNLKNRRNVSCIPEDEYLCVKEVWTKKHSYPHFRILNVPNRSGILVHRITYVKDLRGCIGVGMAFVDFNKDGVLDMASSTIALKKIYAEVPDIFLLKIMEKQVTKFKTIL